ncbi:hypothetical protein SAMN04489761_4247 [Tenacibaculum sp. MAR_2009_124]|uniref:hypothetical protein n=1 Tax=Tenacibaculum sp. MAR_2009_124 TaxID=1250059 RepID=UPI00089CB918|nr:hypothetical protein [Tenacibaculum sp. MAR_2009_124]SED09218.1 hypothetical protein SAMN04489761_4247 [Tenacibaculum sp. MAR_2009_124]
MKKLLAVAVLVLGTLLFNSCTEDNTLEELETRNETEQEIQLIDPVEVGNPGTDPSDDEEG